MIRVGYKYRRCDNMKYANITAIIIKIDGGRVYYDRYNNKKDKYPVNLSIESFNRYFLIDDKSIKNYRLATNAKNIIRG